MASQAKNPTSGDGEPAPAWHAMDAEAVAGELETHVKRGLTEEEAAARRERHGPNTLTVRQGASALVRFLKQFNQALVYILIVAAVVTLALGEFVDSGVIFGVVLINAIIGFVQEAKALRAIDALSESMALRATVIRDGQRKEIDAPHLAPGDIVVLNSGDRAPADLRLVGIRDLFIDESALTGEAVPVGKNTATLDEHAALADRHNMAYASTVITRGHGTGIVTAIGDATEVGKISEMVSSAERLQTPLTRRIASFSRLLVIVILVAAALTFVVGVLRGQTAVDMFMVAVALAVGSIPEGLPAAMTIMLAVGVSRMAKRKAIIRRLPAVEALGSVTVICSDKTGTLTKNEMTVRRIVAGGEFFEVSGEGYDPEGDITRDGDGADAGGQTRVLTECLRAGALCNDAAISRDDDRWTVRGDPTEAALLVSALKAEITREELQDWERLDAIPFESDLQYMATLHRLPEHPDKRMIFVKGSVERLLELCETEADPSGQEGATRPLNIEAIHYAVGALSSEGLRVLAIASMPAPDNAAELSADMFQGRLTLLGLQAMLDPPRPEAIRAVSICHKAGIQVKMITGDHALTASSIAAMIGLRGHGEVSKEDRPAAVTSREMEKISEEELPQVAEETDVFARMTPEQKLRLVKALQQRHHIVAMTGDGVNDAPALRQADIGVAMGRGGTEAAKEASDIVLADDNFASIEAAVEEGRAVYANLLKFIVWTLPTNGGQGLIILAPVVFGATLPIMPAQALYINMFTALLLGIPLVFEPKERELMENPPHDPRAGILTFELIMRIGLVSLLLMIGGFGLFQWELSQGASVERARTVAVSVVVIGELFYLFNCRSLTQSMFKVGAFSNPLLLGGAAAMLLVQFGYAHLPFMQKLFGSEALDLAAWGRVFAVGLAIALIVAFEKWVRRNLGKAGKH